MSSYPLYPEITPFASGYLNVSGVHAIYYEECGSPSGYPVVFLHGGPGSGCGPMQRRFFDPNFYRIILFDQRGCGRSLPLGETAENTTAHLVGDIETLRNTLNINKWLVFGGSWGSTLALAYAIAHPQAISGLILRGIFLSRPAELQWFLSDVQRFFPEVYAALQQFLPPDERENVLESYTKRVFSTDSAIHIPAATQWNEYESQIMTLLPQSPSGTKVPDDVQVARARVQIHYIQAHCFIDGAQILHDAPTQLANTPTWIIQGRYDMVCPPETAWLLASRLPHAQYTIVPDAGHSAIETGTSAMLIAATEAFKKLV
jgi:proline iminopeptidase